MFCPNCGKTIDDNAPFCGFCGTPTGVAASAPAPAAEQPAQPVIPQNPVPQNPAPQNTVPQNTVPQQYAAPQNPAPQGSAPQYAAPVQQPVSVAFTLDAKMINIIDKSIRAVLIILSILIIIGAIGSMAVAGAISSALKNLSSSGLSNVGDIKAFYGLARVPSIIAFCISIGGLAFTILVKKRSLFSYMCAGAGLLLFIFNFVMYGGFVSLKNSLENLSFSALFSGLGGVSIGGIIVAGIFLLISALAMIAASLVMLLNKEDIIKFKPKY